MTTIAFLLKEKVASLEAALLSAHPTMPTLLKEIHTTLRAQPENVTLMSEEEISVIVRGLQKQTGTYLAESVSKSAKKPGSVAALKAKGEDAF
jgi:hypothetical protein